MISYLYTLSSFDKKIGKRVYLFESLVIIMKKLAKIAATLGLVGILSSGCATFNTITTTPLKELTLEGWHEGAIYSEKNTLHRAKICAKTQDNLSGHDGIEFSAKGNGSLYIMIIERFKDGYHTFFGDSFEKVIELTPELKNYKLLFKNFTKVLNDEEILYCEENECSREELSLRLSEEDFTTEDIADEIYFDEREYNNMLNLGKAPYVGFELLPRKNNFQKKRHAEIENMGFYCENPLKEPDFYKDK